MIRNYREIAKTGSNLSLLAAGKSQGVIISDDILSLKFKIEKIDINNVSTILQEGNANMVRNLYNMIFRQIALYPAIGGDYKDGDTYFKSIQGGVFANIDYPNNYYIKKLIGLGDGISPSSFDDYTLVGNNEYHSQVNDESAIWDDSSRVFKAIYTYLGTPYFNKINEISLGFSALNDLGGFIISRTRINEVILLSGEKIKVTFEIEIKYP